MNASDLLLHLNNQQRVAVSAPRENFLVLAGAGSGKTRVLSYRIAWLIEKEKFSPQSIIAVTFTNKAAKELSERVRELIGTNQSDMWIGTFHALSYRFLCSNHMHANLPKDFQILDSDDQLRLLTYLMKGMNIDQKKWEPRQGVWYINDKKEKGLRPGQLKKSFYQSDQIWLRIYEVYQEACDRSGLVDFTELLLRVCELWQCKSDILKNYHRQFTNILVDEFQDTNALQYSWIRALSGEQSKVVIVGDDDQSIYGWRGAQTKNMQQFFKDFPLATTIRLERNYRSTLNILKAANTLISNNNNRLGKELWTKASDGEPILLYYALNAFDEARFVVNCIQLWAKDRKSLRDCAILYRNNSQSREIEEALVQKNIAYQIYSGIRFFQRKEIKDSIAYLRLIANRNDDLAFERIVNTPRRGIGLNTLEILRQISCQRQITLWTASLELLKNEVLFAHVAASALKRFIQLVDSLEASTTHMPLHMQTERILQDSGLWRMYATEKSEKGQIRIENLEELINTTRQYYSHHSKDTDLVSLKSFLSQSALDINTEENVQNQNAVQLMTIHASKGLEFSQVFIVGMEEGIFPGQFALQESHRLEEERRLAYVGVTRAMKRLILSYVKNRRVYGKEVSYPLSRFVKEIPDLCIKKLYFNSQEKQLVEYKNKKDRGVMHDSGFSIAQRVWHVKFGEGVIMHITGYGAQTRLQVDFRNQGVKWLLAIYATLEIR
ncbi:DNA helicase II [Candidatus Erwinia haradaeae]|uniref:DNA 3'-5' helicase n=1 Tax=Candidatus Erwinia haradaeae TaxID=1922217 RepID=A0A451D391_9GAMM|nr:DNA helicase II [Candidatus Erwinia haradaeae]VFP80134.1 DNA helicase II [Candidatus Erwinia haradaeae]